MLTKCSKCWIVYDFDVVNIIIIIIIIIVIH